MAELLALLTGFPTVIWTTMMMVILGYWSLVIVGALGIDLFPGDAEADSGEGGGALAEILSLGQVPVTIVISLLVLKAWALSLFAQLWIMPYFAAPLLVGFTGAGIFLTSLVVAVGLTSYSARPLRPLFRVHTTRGAHHLIGGQVDITSSKVNERFGTAIYHVPDQDGQELTLNVTCDIANDLGPDARAVITDYNPHDGSYTVRPLSILPPASESQR